MIEAQSAVLNSSLYESRMKGTLCVGTGVMCGLGHGNPGPKWMRQTASRSWVGVGCE